MRCALPFTVMHHDWPAGPQRMRAIASRGLHQRRARLGGKMRGDVEHGVVGRVTNHVQPVLRHTPRQQHLVGFISYRDTYQRARCVVPASGYFEWQTTDGSKQPYYIHPAGNAPALLFAGLWSSVTLPDYEGLTCTVLTESARTALDAIHDRMPVIVDPDGART